VKVERLIELIEDFCAARGVIVDRLIGLTKVIKATKIWL
jgi:hypothetical protein